MAEKREEQGEKEPAPTKESDASTVSQEEADQAPGSQQDPDESRGASPPATPRS